MRLRSLYETFIGWRVLAGPFRGLRYVPEAVGSVHAPKLLGTYEQELRPWIETLVARQPPVVVNIGAGEGYYAVGFARRLPNSRILAFEADPRGRAAIDRLAALNGVAARVEIRGLCRSQDLATAMRGTKIPVVVIDAEGAEAELLDPVVLTDLARALVLVEVHDFISNAIGDQLRQRFAATHRIEEIWSQRRTAGNLPGWTRLVAITPWRRQAIRAMDEQRPGPMRWFWLEPLAA